MLLLSTSSLKGYGIHKIFTIAKKAKYDGIDLVVEKLNYDTWDEKYLSELSNAFELPIFSITAPEKGLDKQKVDKIINIATETKAQIINFYPSHITDKNMGWFFKYLVKIKRDTRKTINLINVDQKFLFFILPEYKNSSLLEIKKITGDTALNIGNIDKNTGIDLLKAQGILGNTITNVYLCDRNGPKNGLLPGSAGGGVSYLPLESFLMKLRTSGYGGYFSLKVRPSELGSGNDEKVMQNLSYLKNYYKKHFLDYK